MPDLQILFWARAIERLLIVAFSGASIFLGWNLFRVGVLDTQSAELSGSSWSIKLQRVGPGVFFALFAVVGFAYALSHPLQWSGSRDEQSPTSPNSRQELMGTYIGNAGTPADLENESLAINTMEKLVIPKAMGTSTSHEKEATQRALKQLQERREQLLFQIFGPVKKQYEEIEEQSLGNPSILSKLSQADRKNLRRLQALKTDTFLRE